MGRFIVLLLISYFISSCQQDEIVQPAIRYVNLSGAITNHEQSYHLDIDQDGDTDFLFTTVFLTDELGAQYQFLVYPSRANQVFEIAGRVGVLAAMQEIAPGNPFDSKVQPMVVKSITADGITWMGDWKDATNQYVGIRFTLQDQAYYYGWIRVSFDRLKEQLIIHDFAYRTVVNSKIEAGDK